MRFPISRDPPEGGTFCLDSELEQQTLLFPISRDPPEGGTRGLNVHIADPKPSEVSNF